MYPNKNSKSDSAVNGIKTPKTFTGYVVVSVNAITQAKKFYKLEDIKLDPTVENSLTLGQILETNAEALSVLENEYNKLNSEFMKFKDDTLKSQSENLQLFNKLNENQSILINKVSKLENTVATLLSVVTSSNTKK